MGKFASRTVAMKAGLLGIFVFSLIVRLVGIYIVTTLSPGGQVPERYTDIANNIVAGKSFIDNSGTANTFEPPIYPYFISIIFSAFGENVPAVKVVQAILDSLNVFLIFLITKAIFNIHSAFWASIIYSLYPVPMYSVADIGPETIFGLLLNGSVLVFLLALRSNKIIYYVFAGLLFAIATLTRATTLYFLPFLTLCLLFTRIEGRSLVKPMFVMVVTFVITILPWTIRNYLVSSRFIPVAVAGFGEVFLQGSSEDFLVIEDKKKNFPSFFSQLKTEGIELPPHATPRDFNYFAVRAGWEKYKERWRSDGFVGSLKFIYYKFLRLWYSTESGTNHSKILLVNIFILPFALIGSALSLYLRVSMTMQVPIYLLLLYFVVLHTATLPLHRYMVPVMPYLIVYEAFFFSQVAVSLKRLKNAQPYLGLVSNQ